MHLIVVMISVVAPPTAVPQATLARKSWRTNPLGFGYCYAKEKPVKSESLLVLFLKCCLNFWHPKGILSNIVASCLIQTSRNASYVFHDGMDGGTIID